MQVYRIVQKHLRTTDLSGIGAFHAGGRWNSKGTYMIYTSENSSLAYLENLVHFDKSLMPPELFIMTIDVDDASPIKTLIDAEYPADWMKVGLLASQHLGDRWMADVNYIGVKVKSAVNPFEFNYLLNPLYPGFLGRVKISSVTPIDVDGRLVL